MQDVLYFCWLLYRQFRHEEKSLWSCQLGEGTLQGWTRIETSTCSPHCMRGSRLSTIGHLDVFLARLVNLTYLLHLVPGFTDR